MLVDGGYQDEAYASAPAAYVNIIIFDKNYQFLDAAYQQVSTAAEQVGPSPDVAHEYLVSEYIVEQQGFVFMYVSNNSPVNVYFDDVSLSHSATNVIQYNEYYPFGLQTARSWTRENASNRYLYNGGNELNENSGWYETFFRAYDAAIGRFMQVDPLASSFGSHSPYHYAYNNPMLYNDVMGDSATSGSGFNGRIGPFSGNHWTDQHTYIDAETFIARANHTSHGGTWSNGQAHYFSADEARSFVRNNFYWNQYGGEELHVDSGWRLAGT